MREWLGHARWFALGLIAIGTLGCNSHHGVHNGTSETHFLRSCSESSCQDGYECLCGVCTLACEDDAVCKMQGNASSTCSAPSADRNECGGVTKLCDLHCTGDGDCRALGGEFDCESGRCRVPMSVPEDAGAMAGRGAGSGGRSAGSGGGGASSGSSGSAGSMPSVIDGGAAPSDGGVVADGGGSSVCDLPPETGGCDALFPRFYYDSASDSCLPFNYGGCEGNGNNFETLAACKATCGGSVPACELPSEVGPCDAAITRYYHDAATGRCRQFTYGGCAGNSNNFLTLEDCQGACPSSGPSATACEVNGVVYPSGTDGIDDPTSCNKCICNQGQLICTEIACAEPCPDGTTFSTSCSQCGPTDACEVLRSGCLPTCETTDDCTGDAPHYCFDGICRTLCG